MLGRQSASPSRYARNVLVVLALAVAFLTPQLLVAGPVSAQPAPTPVMFGMDIGSIDELTANGVKPQLASYWTGAWNAKHGWGGAESALKAAKAKGVTPLVHWYYWGDDISPACVENGCWSTLHGVQKTKGDWNRMAGELADLIRRTMGGAETIVVVETEFNKHGIPDAAYAPKFDAYLRAQIDVFHAVPGTKTLVGFGNWYPQGWDRFPSSMAATELVGFQTMRGSTRDSVAAYEGAPDAIASGLRTLRDLFGKPVILIDLALASYPDVQWTQRQDATLKEIFARMDEYRALGLVGLVYRELKDNPSMSTANYYGDAERTWGFIRSDGVAKPSLTTWVVGVGGRPPPPPPAKNAPGAIEAEAMALRTAGGMFNDGSASGGRIWNLWSTGHVSDVIRSPAGGEFTFTIVAKGTSAGGVWPRMQLWVNDVKAGEWDVVSKSLMNYPVRVNLPAGKDVPIRIHYTNDAVVNGEDRNLILDVLRMDSANHVPVAKFVTTYGDGLLANFDASPSSDADGDALAYAWDLGDGTTATGVKVSRDFQKAGTYTVKLTVNDGRGGSATYAQPVSIGLPPRVQFIATPKPLAVDVDASASSDPRGQALTYRWDWGDGTAPGEGVKATHAYATPGTYRIVLTLSNGRDTATGATQVQIAAPPSQPKITYTPARLEAENAADKTVGARYADGAASGAAGWLLWSNGALRDTLIVPQAGEYEIGVHARGNQVAHEWSRMRLMIDGRVAADWSVVSTQYLTYKVRERLAADMPYRIEVQFTNDAYIDSQQDRNLWVDAMDFTRIAPPIRVEVEKFPTRTVGGAFPDGSASEKAFWNLWTNGYVETRITVPAGATYRAEIVAKGQVAGGVWPLMEMWIDGVKVGEWSVSTSQWTTFAVARGLAAGEHAVRIVFTNDAVIGSEDRNLLLDVVRITQA